MSKRQLRPAGVADRGVGAADRLRHDRRGLDGVGDRAGHLRLSRPSSTSGSSSCVVAIALITIGNLRGLREAGNLFAVPTYLFVVSALLMIAVGSFRIVVLGERTPYNEAAVAQPGRRELPGRHGPPPAPRVRRRRRRPDRARRRSRRACRRSSRPRRRTRRRPSRVMAALLGHPVHRPDVPRRQLRDHPHRAARGPDGHQPDRPAGLRRRHDPVLPVPGVHGAAARPGREHELQRVPAAARDPRPRRRTCPASSRSAATGSRSAAGSSSSPSLAGDRSSWSSTARPT